MMDYSRPEAAKRYDTRALSLGAATFDALAREMEKLPSAPLLNPVSKDCHVRYSLCLHAIGMVRAAREVSKATRQVWMNGQFLAASALVRMLIEQYGAVAYGQQKVLSKLERSETKMAYECMTRLLLSASVPTTFGPSHWQSTIKLINVNDFVRAADKAMPGLLGTHAFLCDAAHPSYMPNSLLLLAGTEHDNWSNETFAARMHPTLDKVLTCGEQVLGGLASIGSDVFSKCLPLILAEVRTGPEIDP